MSRRGPQGVRPCRPLVIYSSRGRRSNPRAIWGAVFALAALFAWMSFITPPTDPLARTGEPQAPPVSTPVAAAETPAESDAPEPVATPAQPAAPVATVAKPEGPVATVAPSRPRPQKRVAHQAESIASRKSTPVRNGGTKPRLVAETRDPHLELTASETRMSPRRMTAPK